MGVTCKMNGGKNLKGIYSQKIFSMGITCKLNWENLQVISTQKKINGNARSNLKGNLMKEREK